MITVLYDEDCGFCRWSADKLRRWDTRGRLTFAAIQSVTPNQMRGQVTALYLFVFTVIGQGLGPVFISLFTDFVWAFEMTAVLLVIAVVGSVVLARRSGHRAEVPADEAPAGEVRTGERTPV